MKEEAHNIFAESIARVEQQQLLHQIAHSTSELSKAILEATPWWQDLFTAFFGALFGALAAFFLNIIYEYRKSQLERNASLNELILLCSINTERMTTFRMQFLEKFSDEFHAFAEHAAQYHPNTSQKNAQLAEEWKKNLQPKLFTLLEDFKNDRIYSFLNGLLIRKWEDVEFASLETKKISFVSDGMPNIIRLGLRSVGTIESFKKAHHERRILREECDDTILSEAGDIDTVKFMQHLYELITVREQLAEYAKEAITMLYATMLCIRSYQNEKFADASKRTWISRCLIKAYDRVSVDIPEAARDRIMDLEKIKHEFPKKDYEKIKPFWGLEKIN